MAIRDVEVQRMVDSQSLPNDEELQLWVEKALSDYSKDAEVVIRIVDTDEISGLNQQYRLKTGPTNILSFPFEVPEGVSGLNLLGDLVVCAEVLQQEAIAQRKTLKDHWAHIIIHGILHLIGYDHIKAKDALEMEAKEIHLLQQLRIDNPYQETEVNG
ncbi:probable rRNA maturation factor [Bathymodiolus japonicus methanotrophic gill symbiont]|uniref:rRNA maturation RNase YbeY n=1 Tax=Bathymodiolus japonicus methanotrophic gill symbiont TaxID=113269 RepID=UPI001B5D971E|nr:rRNA maturation RNase YbeY [Bathymodiolus japonicus methanotrophic gill symbiont]GFO72258.1 probable rRNA maturation factor [Bathymodiolus japonicus methanotrophic gill symbiont]